MSSDLTPVEVRQADLAYYAVLEPPPFALGGRWVELQSAMYAHLRRFKLRLSDIKVESTTANPGDLAIVCWMDNYGVLARYRLDRVEVWSSNPRLAANTALVKDMVVQTMEVLRSVSPDTSVTVHSVNASIHGTLPGQCEVAARIASYVTKRPDGLPPLTPSGVSFLCEFPSGQGQGSIILEQSTLVPGGAFLRVMSEHIGSLSEGEALDRATEFFQAATARLGLEVIWGT